MDTKNPSYKSDFFYLAKKLDVHNLSKHRDIQLRIQRNTPAWYLFTRRPDICMYYWELCFLCQDIDNYSLITLTTVFIQIDLQLSLNDPPGHLATTTSKTPVRVERDML